MTLTPGSVSTGAGDGSARLGRSAASRLVSVAALLASVALLVSSALAGSLAPDAGTFALAAVAAAALLSGIWGFGDRFVVDREGIAYENRWLSCWPFRRWTLRFDAIDRVSAHRGVLVLTAGRERRVLDSIEGLDEVRALLALRGLLPGARAERGDGEPAVRE